MAKKGRRGGRKLLKGRIIADNALGALADVDVIAFDLAENVNERTFALSTECTWAINNHTVGEGPIHVGWAHGDYSDAEIEAWVENTGSWNEGDLVSTEVARRKIRQVGTFAGLSTDEVLNDGKSIKTTLKFILNQGEGLKMWAYNESGGVLTTGTRLVANGHCWLRPTG